MAPIPNPSFPSELDIDAIDAGLTASPMIPFGEYVFRRLRQLSVKSIFGVPGDFNLPLLDHIKSVDDMRWVGCCNELNASYAADGYARFLRSIGCVITTLGVGELSCVNGVSGAFAEYVPVLHITGAFPVSKRSQPGQIHHLVPTRNPYDVSPDYQVYEKMVDGICIAKESVLDVNEGVKQVDSLLEKIIKNARPGYLYLPLDLQNALVDSSRLATPLQTEPVDPNPLLTKEIGEKILDKLYLSLNPVVIGDVLTDRFHISHMLREFVDRTKINNYSTPMGKSLLDEANESYIADYNGKLSNPGVQAAVEALDCALHFGAYLAEYNTGKYLQEFKPEALVLLTPYYIKVGETLYKDVHFTHVLKYMLKELDELRVPKTERPKGINTIITKESKADISESFLASSVQKYFQPKDIIVAETCSFQFAFSDIRLPKSALFFLQSFYMSIGYALPATLGIGIAMQDLNYEGRLILFEGDGSAQMTVQEFATYMRHGLKPTVFLLNNSGYTVERIIHGMEEVYNDIQPDWDWCNIFRTLGDRKGDKSFSKRVATKEELVQTLADEKLAKQERVQLYEVILDKFDVPWRFSELVLRFK